jgi:hypothetical protein
LRPDGLTETGSNFVGRLQIAALFGGQWFSLNRRFLALRSE